jgi:hypothetical protein
MANTSLFAVLMNRKSELQISLKEPGAAVVGGKTLCRSGCAAEPHLGSCKGRSE